MQRCGVAVVQSDSMEIFGCDFSVFLHVGPQVRAVLRPLAITEFDTVTPAYQLPAQVHVGAYGKHRHRQVLTLSSLQVIQHITSVTTNTKEVPFIGQKTLNVFYSITINVFL